MASVSSSVVVIVLERIFTGEVKCNFESFSYGTKYSGMNPVKFVEDSL